MSCEYEAILLVSFGGPEGPEDVIPFLENVLRGKPVPRERMLVVAEHYYRFGGVSPINAQNRVLIRALESLLAEKGPRLPIYFGNRNWHPLLPDTLRQMAADGIQRAVAFVTSAFSSYSGCRQYRENIAAAQEQVGPNAPQIDKLRIFYNHPGFIEAVADHVRNALRDLVDVHGSEANQPRLVFTAHSIPTSMAAGCDYEAQLREACGLVAERVGYDDWDVVYQSRSGPPQQPWLEPDICDFLEKRVGSLFEHGAVIVPIGFLSDHLEVIYDLDVEARAVCEARGIPMVRAATAGCHPALVEMIRELILERCDPDTPRRALGTAGPRPDVCAVDCCLPPQRPATP